jgi:ABC transport system ATP-binding/permease protein
MFKLVIQDDEGKTTVVPLVRDEITIGRKEGNTIRLTERNVSRKHARISRANGAVAIEDLGSYNGVRVNGTRISQRTVLAVSDRVQIGDYLIELKAEGVEQPVPYEDARTQPIERLDPAQLAAAMPPPQMVHPPAVAGLADTDPAARAIAPAAATAGNARLVVLSSNFAGREFPLSKLQTVIGRTDDNDVVLNHRSISRNHAKVVREAESGRYTIMDLQSSNGVRVNGEDYGKVELRRGDTVDLGHVRFRFVDVGEDFVFGRDAQIVDVPTGKSKTWLFALLGLVVVGGAIVVVASSGGSKKSSDTVAGKKPGVGSVVATGPGTSARVTAGTDPAGPGSAVETHPGAVGDVGPGTPSAGVGTAGTGPNPGSGGSAMAAGGDAAKFLGDARTAIEASEWADASDLANQALKLDPGNNDARALADQAKRELANSNAFADFNAAATRKQYESAATAFDHIGNDSVYKNKARDQYDRLHAQYVTDQKRQGQALAKAGKCKELDRLATEASRVFSDAGDAVRGISCDTEIASSHTPGSGGGSNTGSSPGSSGSGTPTAPADAEALMKEASAAAMNGQYGQALNKAEAAIKAGAVGAVLARVVNIAALAACNLKQHTKAKSYFQRSSSGTKISIRQACLKVDQFDPGKE